MKPNINDVFIGGVFGASLLGIFDSESEVPTKSPLISAISIRFNPDVNLLKETIQENFLKEPTNFIVFCNSKKYEIGVYKLPKEKSDEPILRLHGCGYDQFKNDALLTVIIRSSGSPNPVSITLLRHFIKKLQDKKIKYEIW